MKLRWDNDNIGPLKTIVFEYKIWSWHKEIASSIFLSFDHFKLYFTIFLLAASVSNEIEKFTFSWMTLKNKINYTQGKRRETNLPTTDRHVFLNNNGLANFFMTTKIERIIYCSSNDFHIWQNRWNLSWLKFDSFRS